MAEKRVEPDNERRIQMACQSASEDQGTPYPCKQGAIDRIDPLRYILKSNNGPFTTASKAAEEVDRWNCHKNLSQDESSATTRLYAAVENVRLGHDWMPDLIIKMVPDIDLVFFGGRLSGNLYATWVDAEMMEGHFPGSSKMNGVTFRLPGGGCQAWIWLNASAIFDSPPENHFMRSWACLLHEMWYVLLLCAEPPCMVFCADT